jgi:hypothetical protein
MRPVFVTYECAPKISSQSACTRTCCCLYRSGEANLQVCQPAQVCTIQNLVWLQYWDCDCHITSWPSSSQYLRLPSSCRPFLGRLVQISPTTSTLWGVRGHAQRAGLALLLHTLCRDSACHLHQLTSTCHVLLLGTAVITTCRSFTAGTQCP